MFENELFQSDQLLPEGQDPEIVELRAAPYSDNRRVSEIFRLSPFNTPPSATIKVLNAREEELATTDLVNILHLESEITLHLPSNGNQPGKYKVVLDLFRLEDKEVESEESQNPKIDNIHLQTRSCSFILP